MTVPPVYRQLVVARAGGACEYCRLVESACGVTFHIEHILPQSLGGSSTLDNLALSCPGCNFAKADHIVGLDHKGTKQRLFDPRKYEPTELGWHLHFMLSRETGAIAGRSRVGEATVRTLDMNNAIRLFARMLQIRVGLIA